MDKFKALEPVRLYQQTSSPSQKPNRPPPRPIGPLVGRLPQHIHLLIFDFLPVPDYPAYFRTCRAVSRFASSEEIWGPRYQRLRMEESGLASALDGLEARVKGLKENAQALAPPTLAVDDEFGDFTTANSGLVPSGSLDLFAPAAPDELGDFVGGSSLSPGAPVQPPIVTSRSQYIRVHNLLKPLTPALLDPPHQILTNLFATSQVPLREQARIIHLLFLFLSPRISPLRSSSALLSGLRAAADRFDSALLTAFEAADSRADEEDMRHAAEASWEVWTASQHAAQPSSSAFGTNSEWEMGRVWAEKREIFYTAGDYKPRDNFTYVAFPCFACPFVRAP
jgi:recyclin-1